MDQQATERIHRSEAKTDIYRSARPVVIWVIGTIGGSALVAAGAAHRTLWDHDGAIKVHEEWQKNHIEQTKKDESRIEDRLKTIEMKIDKLIDLRIHRASP